MNIDISKCRPFDGTKAKVGDVVVHQFGSLGRFIAYVEDSAPQYACVIKWKDSAAIDLYSTDGKAYLSSERSVFLPPIDPLDEIDPSPGNVDKLTRRQVGDGWRIVEYCERPTAEQELWCCDHWEKKWLVTGPNHAQNTYRVPITPTAVPLGPEDIVLGKTVVRTKAGEGRYLVSAALPTALCVAGEAPIFVTWDSLRVGYDISFDHGVTWQKAEKKGGQAR